MAGDLTAAKIVLDRILPPLKPVSAPVFISQEQGTSLVEKAEAILSAAASGEISSDIAAQLIQAVANLCRIIENEELKDRIQALEQALKPNPQKRWANHLLSRSIETSVFASDYVQRGKRSREMTPMNSTGYRLQTMQANT